jgi:hypothetical protein
MPEHSRRTVTASDARKRRWLEDPEPSIALRAWSASIGNQEHEPERGQATYVCGAHPDCAIVIDDPQISSRHALLERRGDGERARAPMLRVRDTWAFERRHPPRRLRAARRTTHPGGVQALAALSGRARPPRRQHDPQRASSRRR